MLTKCFMPASNRTLYFKDCRASVYYQICTEIADRRSWFCSGKKWRIGFPAVALNTDNNLGEGSWPRVKSGSADVATGNAVI